MKKKTRLHLNSGIFNIMVLARDCEGPQPRNNQVFKFNLSYGAKQCDIKLDIWATPAHATADRACARRRRNY